MFSNVKNMSKKIKNEDSTCYHRMNFGIIWDKDEKTSVIEFSTPLTPNMAAIMNIMKNISSISTGPNSSTEPVIYKVPVIMNFTSIEYWGRFTKA